MSEDTRPEPDGILRRPAGYLHDLPFDLRWEVTRRHPYYLGLWEAARLYRDHFQELTPDRQVAAYAAMLVLEAIGVTGRPVDPATPADEILRSDDPAFLTATVQPVTLRALVATLLTVLPPAEQEVVGHLLKAAGTDKADAAALGMPPAERSKLVFDLNRINSPALDACPDAPLFYVHLGASQRSLARDMEDQVRAWKAKRGEGKTQVQVAKIPDQLAAWDLREGWAGSGYDPARERPFKEVARELGVRLPTAVARYRAAFEWIAGHPFQPKLWWQLFGPSWLGRPWGPSPAGARRPLSSPVRRPVPDTVVSHSPDDARREGVVERGSAVGADAGWSDLLLDLREMIAGGASDIDIARRLGRDDPRVGAAARARIDDLSRLTE